MGLLEEEFRAVNEMYLLDTNIRSATLLGVVGAGGIGAPVRPATLPRWTGVSAR